MSERWPAFTKYFGLEGVELIEDGNVLRLGEYIKTH